MAKNYLQTHGTAMGTNVDVAFANIFTTTVETELLNNNNNNELYLHDHTSTSSIAKAIFRNQNYNTGQLRYFDNNLSRTSKQAEIYFMNCILIK